MWLLSLTRWLSTTDPYLRLDLAAGQQIGWRHTRGLTLLDRTLLFYSFEGWVGVVWLGGWGGGVIAGFIKRFEYVLVFTTPAVG